MKKILIVGLIVILFASLTMTAIPISFAESSQGSESAVPGVVGGDIVRIYDLSGIEKDGTVLAYVFTKPVVYEGAVSPYLIPLESNDPLFENTITTAECLCSQGFSVTYSNIAYHMYNASYSTRISIKGSQTLFETAFKTTLQSSEYGYCNATEMLMPEAIKASAIDIELSIKPLLFSWPTGWAPPQPVYYHLSPNDQAKADMGATNWANSLQSAENAMQAVWAKKKYAYNGQGVNVAVIDTGFSRNHGTTTYYPTANGFHPFYEEYYADLLQNRYVSHANGGVSPDDDAGGHGTGIVSNLLAVAPGITLHFISQGGGFSQDAANALTIALGINNLGVLSCSWGWSESDATGLGNWFTSIEDTINQLVYNGVIVCFAAGNGGGQGGHVWPASMPTVVAVGGVYPGENGDFQAASYASSFDSSIYSNRHVPDFCGIVGQMPDINHWGILIEMPTQPGSEEDRLFSWERTPYEVQHSVDVNDETGPNDGWMVASGTSSATPQVAGLAAIVKQMVPSAGVSTFKNYVESCARDITTGVSADGQSAGIGYDMATGYGLADNVGTILYIKAGKTMTPAYTNGWNSGAEDKVGLITTQWDSHVDASEGEGYTYALAEAFIGGAGGASAWIGLGDYWRCSKTGKYEVTVTWSYSGRTRVFDALGVLGVFSEIRAGLGAAESLYTVFSRETWIAGVGEYIIDGSIGLKFTVDAVSGQDYYWYTTLKSWVVASAVGPSVAGGSILVNGRVHGVTITPIQETMIVSGLNWLRRTQGTDGSWTLSGSFKAGVTSLAVMCFINHGNSPFDPTVLKGLNLILSMRNIDGSFGGEKTYETSIAIMALSAARSTGYNPSTPNVDQYITDAMNWLLSSQNIGSNIGISPGNKYYGGWGYSGASSSWADLSNTQFAMIALSLAESYLKVPPHVGNWQAAAIFVARCNNNATNNPQFYYTNDGGFIYQPQSTTRTDSGISYGSMTAAGVWALGLARMAGVNQINMQLKNIDSIDPIYSGLNWLRGHYSVTQNPVNYYWGGESFKYYYLWTIAKTWEIMGQETVAGHNWYAELISHLDSVQSSDGHWPGTGSEEPNALATEWAILSIEVPIVPQTVLENSKLKAILNSGADLHIYDQQGRHVGYNYTTQQNEIQIPGATYTGRESEPQIITIPLTEGLKFTMEVVGTTGGPYELVVDLTTYDVVVAERSFSGTTSPGVVFPYSVEAVTVAGLSLFVQPPISLATTLEIGTLATSGQYSDPVALSATLKEFATSSPISGKTISFTIGTQTATGTTNTSGVATVSINLNQPSGAYTVTASFAGDSTYQSSSDSKPFTIDKENVAITYTGNTLVFTAGPTISTAPVHLATHLVQESDGYPGDLTLASVTFALFRSSNFGSIPDLTYDASVDSAGDAHYDVASLAADVWTVRVTVKSGNLYWTQTLEGLGILVVSLPGLSATGGGWIPDSGSANGKDNFGFTVQYNKNQAPKGNFVFVLRGKDGYDYVVKSNSWQGGGLSFTGTNKVYFSGKCNVQKIDKTTGAVVASWGNYRFAVDITDGDLITPHTTDTIAIRILNSINAIWQQIGTSTAQIPLGGGNIVIHSK